MPREVAAAKVLFGEATPNRWCGLRPKKAIQVMLTNYHGAKVGGIPEADGPSVLLRLALAAKRVGHLQPEAAHPAPVYQERTAVLVHFGLLDRLTS